jgi:hypothetical protein
MIQQQVSNMYTNLLCSVKLACEIYLNPKLNMFW